MQKKQTPTHTTDTKLPSNFAQEVMQLELEIEVNSKASFQKINRLIELYSTAVQYYESIQSNNYKIFKNKIVNLMLKPSVNRSAEKQSRDNKEVAGSTQISKKQQLAQVKRDQLEQNLQVVTNSSQLNARRMVMGADSKFQNVNKRIDNEISKQELRIEQRIRMRKGKVEVTSLGSTQSDPKQKQPSEKDDIFCFEAILELQNVEEGSREQKQTKQQLIEEIPKAVQTIQIKFDEPKPKKQKVKKQVLTLKPNQKAGHLPEQYSIPF